MIAYFDTSAFVPLVIDEPASRGAQALWDAADQIVSVRLLYPEARAALARARTLKRVTPTQLRAAVEQADDLMTEIAVVELTAALAREAGELAERMSLRGYDAVHLAAARAVHDDDLVVATNDAALRTAASRTGLATANLL